MTYVINVVLSIISALGTNVPGSEAAIRFRRDVASWAVYTMLARLSRGGVVDERMEEGLLGLAVIAAMGVRGEDGKLDWLLDQVSRASQALTTPRVSARVRDDAQAAAWAMLPESVRKGAEAIRARAAISSATRASSHIEGAGKALMSYLNAIGVFTTGPLMVRDLNAGDREGAFTRIRKALNDLPSALAAFGGPEGPTHALLMAALLRDGTLDDLLEPLAPSFDESWVAQFELSSVDAEDEANAGRHRAELDAMYREGLMRSSGYASRDE